MSNFNDTKDEATALRRLKQSEITEILKNTPELKQYVQVDQNTGEVKFTEAWHALDEKDRNLYDEQITSILEDASAIRTAVDTLEEAAEDE
jgi:uncharacterized iron-regulated protein